MKKLAKKLYDNLYKVIKVNSGAFTGNDGILSEILDLQIPRNYCARIRKVIFEDELGTYQNTQTDMSVYGALVLDPDDETSYQIPTFNVDHDVVADFNHEYILQTTAGAGGGPTIAQSTLRDFDETLDVVTVRNIRFNASVNGMDVATTGPQTRVTVYFTYEKVTADLYAKLLGIS